ncbi:MAG: hypothetical protein KF753_18980 [Caldilineaceae bacterium]|nr:hypothetical protein [Caldilineaceae bacterium]
MIPLTAMSASKSDSNLWIASLAAAIVTAVVAAVMVYTAGMSVVPALFGLLLGAAPLIGYDLARGSFGSNWKPVIGGIIGFILFVAALFLPGPTFGIVAAVAGLLSTLLIWPIVVGVMSPAHSVGKLWLASLLGLIIGLVVVSAVAGQDPNSWLKTAGVLFFACWGGTVGAALSAWSK